MTAKKQGLTSERVNTVYRQVYRQEVKCYLLLDALTRHEAANVFVMPVVSLQPLWRDRAMTVGLLARKKFATCETAQFGN